MWKGGKAGEASHGDACLKYVGEAERAGWESPSEMESMDHKERQLSKGTGENLRESSMKSCLVLDDFFWVSTQGIKGTLWLICAREKGD